jgi:phosphoenolpyruvate carboxykinase (ATP)
MMWHPNKYANLLAEKIKNHNVNAWLVNTGWSGGSYGVGARIKLKYTRAILDAIHNGDFDNVSFVKENDFNLQIPTSCPDVPSEILVPENTWQDQAKFSAVKNKLINLFKDNFNQFKDQVDNKIIQAGPK